MARIPVLAVVLALALVSVSSATPPHSATGERVAAAAKKKTGKKQRRGGKVRAAWPRSHRARAPKDNLARWLAKQVGPVPRKGKKRKKPRARAADSITALSNAGGGRLWLVRSFEIPASDPAYGRLANYSWTYDNALATFAFISVGLRTGAEQVLDQLQALQRNDGSLEFAFDTSTGAAAPYYRSGALAWWGWRPPPTAASTTASATTR